MKLTIKLLRTLNNLTEQGIKGQHAFSDSMHCLNMVLSILSRRRECFVQRAKHVICYSRELVKICCYGG